MPTPFQTAYNAYRSWIGMSGPFHAGRKRGRPPKRRKIVIASDFHIPHQEDRCVQSLLKEADDTDLLIIAGDFLNLGSASRWPKLTKPMPLIQEFATGQAIMSVLAKKFNRIKVLEGNHDKRLIKRLADGGMPEDVLEYFQSCLPGSLNPTQLIVAGFSNVEMVKDIYCGDARYDFLVQEGDLVVGHAEAYSSLAGKSGTNFANWIVKTAIPGRIIESPVRVVLTGHTHGASWMWNDYGIWTGETGCLCRMGDYTSDPKLRTPRIWAPGYFVTEQVGGVTDINKTRFVSLE